MFGKWATARRKSIAYYHHHDGDLHHADWRTADVCAIGIFAPVLLVTMVNYTGVMPEISGAGTIGRVCAERKAWYHFLAGRDVSTNCGTLSDGLFKR
ncbi:hypothetical protein KCP76_23170 [Salmonella enterica subsp. enterica serovar Weltevreden]|nr:hypothetical protein KCP76_23170 [Salmonella enterica subsp. enterica serovar Weltevreden]